VQSDAFDRTRSVTICAFTTDMTEADPARVMIEPSRENGLRAASWLMVDKLTTLPREKVGRLIGRLSADDVARVDETIALFLGLA
jgi:mRNA interferase MazF